MIKAKRCLWKNCIGYKYRKLNISRINRSHRKTGETELNDMPRGGKPVATMIYNAKQDDDVIAVNRQFTIAKLKFFK